MTWLALSLVAFVCFALVFWIKQRQFSQPAWRLPYRLKQALFEPAERQLLELLQQSIAADYLLLAKVRIADVVDVTAIPRRGPWYHATNRISAGRFDFLLCDRHTLAPRCVIELEPASAANAFLDELCQTVGLPLVRLPTPERRSASEVREAIAGAIAAPE